MYFPQYKSKLQREYRARKLKEEREVGSSITIKYTFTPRSDNIYFTKEEGNLDGHYRNGGFSFIGRRNYWGSPCHLFLYEEQEA